MRVPKTMGLHHRELAALLFGVGLLLLSGALGAWL